MLDDRIKKIYLGGSEVQKMYLGENLIYPREPAVDDYVMLGTTTGSTDFMIGSSTSAIGDPDCIKVHVVAKEGSANEIYVKASDILKTPMSFYFTAGFCSTEGKKMTSIYKWMIDTSHVTNMDSMFMNSSLVSIDLSNFNTSNVTSMRNMFRACSDLTSLDLRSFDTTNVNNMNHMFADCTKLTSVDLSNFNVTGVTDMTFMFHNSGALKQLDLSSFGNSNVTDTSWMFYNCPSLESIDLSNFNTPNVTKTIQMFADCTKLTSLDLRNFNTTKVTNMNYMFANCTELASLNVSNFNTSNVTTMDRMFYNCRSLKTLDLRNFDTTNVTSMSGMFGTKQYNLHKLYLSSSFFNSTSITTYDFSIFVNWDDAETTTMLANAIKTHDGTGKTLNLSYGTYVLMYRQGHINTITAKGWKVTYSQ